MKFHGTDADLKDLKNNLEGINELAAAMAFNQGYETMFRIYDSLYIQAESAINQNIPIDQIADGSNPFITLLKMYKDKLDADNLAQLAKAEDIPTDGPTY